MNKNEKPPAAPAAILKANKLVLAIKAEHAFTDTHAITAQYWYHAHKDSYELEWRITLFRGGTCRQGSGQTPEAALEACLENWRTP